MGVVQLVSDARFKRGASDIVATHPYERCVGAFGVDPTIRALCAEHGVAMYVVTGSWKPLERRHKWIMFADADVVVSTGASNEYGVRQERSVYFDPTSVQFTGDKWTFGPCYGPFLNSCLVQESVTWA